jgi:hypothetical protein
MGLFEQAQKDFQSITQNLNEFGQSFKIINPDGGQEVDLIGFHTKHHIGYDLDGVMINSKNASVAFSEQLLVDASYPVRNANKEVAIVNHLINATDSSGLVKNYIIQEIYPDEYLGNIVCILGDYETI